MKVVLLHQPILFFSFLFFSFLFFSFLFFSFLFFSFLFFSFLFFIFDIPHNWRSSILSPCLEHDEMIKPFFILFNSIPLTHTHVFLLRFPLIPIILSLSCLSLTEIPASLSISIFFPLRHTRIANPAAISTTNSSAPIPIATLPVVSSWNGTMSLSSTISGNSPEEFAFGVGVGGVEW
ncbi:unnamed protein product [Periconia digitata]|uniref:Uncharacterized protein n=1 Tax=Periconia digitata TaxID=1303443 RepID=A0A9W4XG11_9PLEO|nr:unnamed protein product [Periconia digitata]